ncbi:MAG: thiolase family protein [Elusimicrobia bacterium]|nr:thiolase family protein [Elusimicrobiota bacterium]
MTSRPWDPSPQGGTTALFIMGGARTPFATWSGGTDGAGHRGGRLKGLDPFDLGAAALKAALASTGLAPSSLDKVVFGNSYHVGPHACYGGRYVGHRAGVPDSVPGVAVGLACGSGLYAMMVAAQDLLLGTAGTAAAVGADAPSLIRRAVLVPSFTDVSAGAPISTLTHRLALDHGFDRPAQDRWALMSHCRAKAAQARGLFAEEIVPVNGLDRDDAVLSDPAAAHFEQSKPIFEGITTTLANTHAIVDGGAALVMASRVPAPARAADLKPVGRYLAGAVAATEPRKTALACALALRSAACRAGVSLRDIDLFEINETFAAQVLVDMKELSLPEDKVNVNGGAIALGHAFGGTGVRLALTVLKELGRRKLKLGAAAVSLGGGQGVAVVLERL